MPVGSLDIEDIPSNKLIVFMGSSLWFAIVFPSASICFICPFLTGLLHQHCPRDSEVILKDIGEIHSYETAMNATKYNPCA